MYFNTTIKPLCVTLCLLLASALILIGLSANHSFEPETAERLTPRTPPQTYSGDKAPATFTRGATGDSPERSIAPLSARNLVIRATHRGTLIESAVFPLEGDGEPRERGITLRYTHNYPRRHLQNGIAVFAPGYRLKVVPPEDLPAEGETAIELAVGTKLRLELLGVPPHVFTDYRIMLGLTPELHMLPAAIRKPIHVTNVSRRITSPSTELLLAGRYGGRLRLIVFDDKWVGLGTLAETRFRAGQSTVTIDCSNAINFSALRGVDVRLVFPRSEFPYGQLEVELQDMHGCSTARREFARHSDDKIVDIAFSSVKPGQYTVVLEAPDTCKFVLGRITVGSTDIHVSYTVLANANIVVGTSASHSKAETRGVKIWDGRGVYLGFSHANDLSPDDNSTIRIENLVCGTYFLQAVGAGAVSRPARVELDASDTAYLDLPLEESGDVIVALGDDWPERVTATLQNAQHHELLRAIIRSRSRRFTLPVGTWRICLDDKITSVEIRPGQTISCDAND